MSSTFTIGECHLDPKGLRAFANRDWSAAERGKQQYWAERYRGDGAAPARHAATLLLEHARRLGAAMPTCVPTPDPQRLHRYHPCRSPGP